MSSTHESVNVRNRVITDDILRERVASLLAKYAAYIIALGAGATEDQQAWAKYVLADKHHPDHKAVSMMWMVCWHPQVNGHATADITDATISGIVEPLALNY
jgi:hypothetical protein